MSTERSVRVPRTPRLSRVSRRARGGLATLIAGLACTSALAVPLAPLVNEVDLVADATARATQIPLAQTVTITQAGSYVIAVTDLQSPTALAA